MKEEKNIGKYRSKGKKKSSKLVVTLSCIAGVLVIVLLAMLLMIFRGQEPEPTEPTETTAAPETTAVHETTVPETEPTVPAETEPVMLEHMAELYAENPDIVGWVTIEDTYLDYPVMFTPDDEEKYLYANFEGKYDITGLPFLDKDCSMDPESDNLIIYGHNMLSGAAFATLMNYQNQKYWEQHPTIKFTTLYEEREYEIVAAFPDRVYYNYEDVFKFYQFIDAEDEEDFNNAMMNYKEKALYDPGVTAEYGDNLITLVTCAYHHQYGRFVLVGRQVSSEETVSATEEVLTTE